jgi:hypothetical protein
MLQNVIEAMIAKLATVAEVHVIIPAIWTANPAASACFRAFATHKNVTLYPITPYRDNLDALDMDGPTAEIVDIVNAIAPDYCLCRSANPELPQHFPGQLRYVMEAGAPPFKIPRPWISLQPQIFDHGFVPVLPAHMQDQLVAMIGPIWEEMESRRPQDSAWLRKHGLPADRKIIALPLEYDHPDNLFRVHRSIYPNAELITHMLHRVEEPLFLAITDHPLNIAYVDQRKLRATLKGQQGKARLLSPPAKGDDMTSMLTQHADAMIVGDSKSFAAAAFYSKPVMRISKFASGSWLQNYTDLYAFAVDLAAGSAAAPARKDAMLWFAHYLMAQIFAPGDADVAGRELLEQILGSPNPDRWEERIARVKDFR